MELEKRKRENDGCDGSDKRGKATEDDDAVKGVTVPADEEVEEFFAILKRIQIAVKYFQKRNGGRRESSATPSRSLKFEMEDFVGVKVESECSKGLNLDLNSDPVSDHGG